MVIIKKTEMNHGCFVLEGECEGMEVACIFYWKDGDVNKNNVNIFIYNRAHVLSS